MSFQGFHHCSFEDTCPVYLDRDQVPGCHPCFRCSKGVSEFTIPEKGEKGRHPLTISLRILGMSWGVKTTCLEAPGVSLGGSGVSIGGVRSLRDIYIYIHVKEHKCFSSQPVLASLYLSRSTQRDFCFFFRKDIEQDRSFLDASQEMLEF